MIVRTLFLLFLLMAGSLASQAAVIAVTPAAPSIPVGGAVAVALEVSGLGSGVAPSVGVFDLNLSFDPAVLAFSSATFGDQLDLLGFGSINGVAPGLGVVSVFEISLDPPDTLDALQLSAFTLATLVFDGLAPGVSPLTLSVNVVGDAMGLPLDATLVDSAVEVVVDSEIPEPQTMALVAAGLVALPWLRRRTRLPR